MIRTALDSDQLDAFTPNVDFILTYSDLITDPRAFEAEHPGQQVRYIDRGLGDPDLKATIIDIERGAMTPAQLPAWYDERERLGRPYLTMYVNRSNLAAADAALQGRSINRWIATLDGTLHIDGFQPMHWPALVQFAGAAAIGIHADLSLVLSDGWNPSPVRQARAIAMNAIDAAMRSIKAAESQLATAGNEIALLG
jgi:hypothetical protein